MKKIELFGIFFIAVLVIAAVVRSAFFVFVDSHNIAYEYNMQTGGITVFDQTGWFKKFPFRTKIHEIDGRPMQVRIEANNRVLNAKLVAFKRYSLDSLGKSSINKEGVEQFVQMHGRDDYSQQKLTEILKSYAYEDYTGSGNAVEALESKYKFLDIQSSINTTESTHYSNQD